MSIRDELVARAASGEFDAPDGGMEFALDRPRAVAQERRGGKPRKDRPSRSPEDTIVQFRTVYRTDPHVKEMVETIVDYIVGVGFNVAPANIPYTDEGQTAEDIADFKALIESSAFEQILPTWVRTALTETTGFLELVVEEDEFKPKVLQTEMMSIVRDDKGHVVGYEQENPGEQKPIKFGPGDIAMLQFEPRPGQAWGASVLEPIVELSDMLRDMEIDLARFIATKAYPPVVWTLGNDERIWTQTQMQEWLDTLADIEPDSHLAVGHDVDHSIVGTASTSSQAGMLNLESTFNHILMRMHAGIGIPPFLTGMPSDVNRNTSMSVMPKFDRRIQRYRRILRHTIRSQVFRSILAGDGDPADYKELLPDLEFGQHSSEEERLETQEAIAMFSMGFLTREAAAERMGIDPEAEMPDESELQGIIEVLRELANKGDEIQNPDGGSPTANGTGTRDPSDTVKDRQNPERENPDSTPKRDPSNE